MMPGFAIGCRVGFDLLAGISIKLMFLYCFMITSVQATPVACPDEHRIAVEFDNGAGWDLCWESGRRENIVLRDIHFKNPQGELTKVISSLRLAQLHVAYDDSNITYNDVTQFGLGGGYVATLDETECPDGEVLQINGKPGMCKRITLGDDAYRTTRESRLTQALTLFSVSQVGAYSYLVTWKLFDDGSIAPSVGAAGALQRSSDDAGSLFGRELEGVIDKSWLSHTHNYYWRIDFDLGDDAADDVVSEVYYVTDSEGRRSRQIEHLTEESAREIDPLRMLSWHISDGADETLNSRGYLIEPVSYGHKLVRSEVEPFTQYDFFVTRQNDCERFVSENSKYNPGCGDHILEYVNSESLVNQDIVVWHRVSFHHVPRNEDRNHMHSHWDGFLMKARNFSSTTPGHSGLVENSPPELSAPRHLINEINDPVSIALQANDSDGDQLSYSASTLPEGLTLRVDGVLHGSVSKTGNYRSVISVTDGYHTSNALIQWQVNDKSSGTGAVSHLLFWLLVLNYPASHRRKTK